MKKNEVPQDKSFLQGYTKDLYYVQNEKGSYETVASTGWEVKHEALVATWDDIKARAAEVLKGVQSGSHSPLEYYMILKNMNISILSAYTGIRKWRIRRHLKPKKFQKIDESTLRKYASAFDITLEELLSPESFHDK